MKRKIYQLWNVIFSLALPTFLCLTVINAYSQNPTGYCTVLHQPCNNDGVLVTTITSGMTPPLTFYYNDGIGTQHSNVNSLSDTLYGILHNVYGVSVQDNYQHYLWLNTGIVPPFTIDNPTITDAVCPSLTGTAQITINGGAMPDSVHWFEIIGWMTQGPYIGTGNPMNLIPGNYLALVFDNGCRFYSTDSGLYVSNISGINVSTSTIAANCTNGSASVSNVTGGISPYTYLWSNGASTSAIINLMSGYYFVTVTDSQGCYSENYASVNQAINIGINPSVTNATCIQNNGSIITFPSGGTPPYSYQYSSGATTQTASGLSGGNYYSVTVTDANNCIGSDDYIYVNISTPITVTYTTTPSSCTAETGSATLSISNGTTPYTVEWNTYPAQNGISINNMGAGNYSFVVTDAVGCVRTGTVTIPPQSTINASITATNTVCPSNNGATTIDVTGSNPPYSFLWNTGASTQNLSNLQEGFYRCTITDNVSCTVTRCAWVHSVSPVNLGLSTTPASCLYASDGSIYANATGGTAPYNYYWSNGQTGANATGLLHGDYWSHVTDANGCHQSKYTYVDYDHSNDTCYCNVNGKVYVDQNGNCQYDAGETGVEHIMIHCSGFGYTFTNAAGDYSFLVPSGSYTLSESVLYIYPLAPCQSNSIALNVTASSGCTSTIDFANVINPLHDIHLIRTYNTPAIPGYAYTQRMIVQNDGTMTESTIQLGFKHDGQLQYSSTSPNVYTQLDPANEPSWYSVNTGFPNLIPGAFTVLATDFMVPTNIPLGTTVNFFDTTSYSPPMSNWLNDYSPWNNVLNYQTVVVGSFDPNCKEVCPTGWGQEGYITTNDSVLDYIIHFQNTGTYNAQNIVILDTLDANLDWQSLRPGYSNHNYTVCMSETGVLKFTFANINLPYQSQSEIASRGLVAYSIKQKPNLSKGTEIVNSAAIFFDYNAPVLTNATLNTIGDPLKIKETEILHPLWIYPNPATSDVYITAGNCKIKSVSIYDLTGRILKKLNATGNTIQKISVSDIADGIYLVELVTANGKKTIGKFVKD